MAFTALILKPKPSARLMSSAATTPSPPREWPDSPMRFISTRRWKSPATGIRRARVPLLPLRKVAEHQAAAPFVVAHEWAEGGRHVEAVDRHGDKAPAGEDVERCVAAVVGDAIGRRAAVAARAGVAARRVVAVEHHHQGVLRAKGRPTTGCRPRRRSRDTARPRGRRRSDRPPARHRSARGRTRPRNVVDLSELAAPGVQPF